MSNMSIHVHTCPSLFLLSHGLSFFIAKSAGAIRAKSDGTESICVLRLLIKPFYKDADFCALFNAHQFQPCKLSL